MDTFALKIIASDRVFYEGRCRQIIVPSSDGGQVGILPHHENVLMAINVGIARMEIEPEKWCELAVGDGFMEIFNNRVTVLVQTAERPEEIDVRRAREQKERAQEQLRQKQSIREYYHTQASLARAMNRLKISRNKH